MKKCSFCSDSPQNIGTGKTTKIFINNIFVATFSAAQTGAVKKAFF